MIKLICEHEPDNWLEFKDSILRRQRRQYGQAILADNVKSAKGEEAKERARQENNKIVSDILRDVVIDGVIVIDGNPVRGIDAILECDSEGLTIAANRFFGEAFWVAISELDGLGKPVRAG